MDKQTLNSLIDEYIRTHYVPNDKPHNGIKKMVDGIAEGISTILIDSIGRTFEKREANKAHESREVRRITSDFQRINNSSSSKLNSAINVIDSLFKKNQVETFSKMLKRLIAESGEKNSDIYTRANIKRQHFSKMMNDEEYQPSKPTVLAFAIALKLGFEKTRELLASAGYVLTRNKYFDVIVAAFIERKLYDIDLINYTLHEYDQQLLGYF